jgi:hypothetical protein
MGVATNQRSMRTIDIHGIAFKFVIQRDLVQKLIFENNLRVIIVYDHQANGVLKPVTNILYNVDQNLAPHSNTIFNFVGEGVKDRYTLLYDEHWVWPYTSEINTGPNAIYQGTINNNQCPFNNDIYLELNPPLQTKYYSTGNDGDIGDINSGSIIVYCFTDSDVEDAQIELKGMTRIFFKDVFKY